MARQMTGRQEHLATIIRKAIGVGSRAETLRLL
jgi:hypothetical protein